MGRETMALTGRRWTRDGQLAGLTGLHGISRRDVIDALIACMDDLHRADITRGDYGRWRARQHAEHGTAFTKQALPSLSSVRRRFGSFPAARNAARAERRRRRAARRRSR